MKLKNQRLIVFIFIIFLMMACSIKSDTPSKMVNSVKAKSATIKNIKNAAPKLLPMKFDYTDVIVGRYDKGRAFKDRIEHATKLPVIASRVKQIILQYEKREPTQYTLSGGKLNACQLIGKRAEVDAIPSTFEWVVTTADSCYNPSPTKLKTIWLVQLKNNQGKVLLASRGHRILINSDKYTKPDVGIRITAYTKQPDDYSAKYTPYETPMVCYSKWKYSKGKIIKPEKDRAEFYVKDSMLPRSMENMALEAKKASESIKEAVEEGAFKCPQK